MKLEKYLEKYGTGKMRFAEKIGISVQSLYAILRGADTNVSIALKIEEITAGNVTCEDLVSKDIEEERNLDLTPEHVLKKIKLIKTRLEEEQKELKKRRQKGEDLR